MIGYPPAVGLACGRRLRLALLAKQMALFTKATPFDDRLVTRRGERVQEVPWDDVLTIGFMDFRILTVRYRNSADKVAELSASLARGCKPADYEDRWQRCLKQSALANRRIGGTVTGADVPVWPAPLLVLFVVAALSWMLFAIGEQAVPGSTVFLVAALTFGLCGAAVLIVGTFATINRARHRRAARRWSTWAVDETGLLLSDGEGNLTPVSHSDDDFVDFPVFTVRRSVVPPLTGGALSSDFLLLHALRANITVRTPAFNKGGPVKGALVALSPSVLLLICELASLRPPAPEWYLIMSFLFFAFAVGFQLHDVRWRRRRFESAMQRVRGLTHELDWEVSGGI